MLFVVVILRILIGLHGFILLPHCCRFGIVIMVLDGVFMWADVNDNFFQNVVVCMMLLLKMEGGKYFFL